MQLPGAIPVNANVNHGESAIAGAGRDVTDEFLHSQLKCPPHNVV